MKDPISDAVTGHGAAVLRGGLLADGTGSPARPADVRFENGVITEVGSPSTDDAEVIDISGLVVAPGFIDPHTHLDAQVLWDPDLSPSTWHGVTTVVMGNCGFGVAPARLEHRELICRTLENVEGMPLEALEAGIDWSFETFPQYLDALDERPLRANVAAMVGHTPLRIYVMGNEASDRAATDSEIAAMAGLAREALEAGALGLATSRATSHIGAYGAPVPSRLAEDTEIETLVRELASSGRGTLQIVGGPGLETPEQFSRLAQLAQRPMTWTPLFTSGHTTEVLNETASLPGEVWPQMSCRPIVSQATLANPAPFAMLPSFDRINRAEPADRAEIYRDLEWRAIARDEVDGKWGKRWPLIHVKESAAHADLIDGPSLADLASEQKKHPFDVMVDIALSENLETRFEVIGSNADVDEIATLLADDRTLLGLSDAGAHVRELCDACYSTFLLGTWTRERGAISLEKAVWRLTGQPAAVFGLQGKGRIAAGYDADLVAFDATTVGACRPERVRDLPAGADRLIARSTGVEHVWVNGRVSRRDGVNIPGAHHGRLLRHGVRRETVKKR